MTTDMDFQTLKLLIEKETATFIQALGTLRETLDAASAVAPEASLGVNLFLYRKLEDVRNHCDTITKMANRNDPAIADRIIKHMQADDQTMLVHEGYKYEPGMKDYITINKDDQPVAMSWMKNHPIGKELVHETVAPASMTKFMVEQFVDKGETPPSFAKHFPKPNLRVTKSRS